MPSLNHSIILSLVFGTVLSLSVRQAAGQTYIFGTASYPAPGLTFFSPPLPNVPMRTADFNGDGILDVVILGSYSSWVQTLSIYLGRPDGTFAPKVDYPVATTGTSSMFTVGDFNGDGKLDIVLVNNDAPEAAYILLGNGDGAFQAPVELNLGTRALWLEVASADFNGDGKLGLVLLSPNYVLLAGLTVLLGNGDGTFQNPVFYQLTEALYLAVGDFNGDGKPDVAISGSNLLTLLINRGDGTFLSPVEYTMTGATQALAAADFNRDGKLDLVVTTGGLAAVLLGLGDGTFASPVTSNGRLNGYITSIAVADFNGDGRLDLALAPSAGDNACAVILMGNGDGTFQNPPVLYSAGLMPAAVVALDVNGDSRPDLAVVGGYGFGGAGVGPYFSLTVLLNRGDGTFFTGSAYPVVLYPGLAALGDFDADGKTDVAVASAKSNTTAVGAADVLSVLLSNGDGTFRPRLDTPTNTSPGVIAPGDFNGDGKLDLVVVQGTPSNELLSI